MEPMFMVVSDEGKGGGLAGTAYAIFESRQSALEFIVKNGLGAKCKVEEC